jgi:hypothetical protein
MFWRSVKLTRRDFGIENLKRSFPEALAKKLNGDVFAELTLTLAEHDTELRGIFVPQKIDFLLAPPRITGRHWMEPLPRSYQRVAPVRVEESAQRFGEGKGLS